MNSPNLVTIRLLTDCWLTPDWLLTYSWLTLVIATGHNLESYPNQFSKFGYHQTPDWLLTYSWLTPIILWTDLLKQQRFVGDDTRSQFGELSKSALQIWRAVQTSSPNLVTIRLLTDYWLTPDTLLTDSWHTSDRLTLNQTAEICPKWQWAALESSPNLESWFEQLSKLRPNWEWGPLGVHQRSVGGNLRVCQGSVGGYPLGVD